MRVNIFSWLLVFALVCNVSAEITHKVVEEKDSVTLSCPHSVEGKVTWSRERDGHRVDILTADGGSEIRHIKDPGKRYGSQADKALHIGRITISDTGRYFCNNEPAVELTVIPSGKPRQDIAAGASVVLKCLSDVSGSRVPMWTRERNGKNITVFSQNQTDEHRFQYSAEENVLTIKGVRPDDAGLYFCDGKPAAYLNVSKEEESEGGERAAVLLAVILLPLLLIIFIILFLIWRCRIKRRGSGEEMPDIYYEKVSIGSVFEPAQDGLNQNDQTYSVIHELPALANESATSQPSEPLYSLVNKF
ncbi:uncharacterized protein LOC118342849 [Morone saxatilis]|uniref:uncharacterized protein LOC118342849 n=1 Tax=Morone saxatilis TaxID=34816 RepID=UPI0015E1F8C3|nr:uncharacterized protein LOC118342849 [Morone saxatilis]